MVDYTSLSIEEPTADQFRDECPDGLNQSEFLSELLDAYDGTSEESAPVDAEPPRT